MAVRLTSALMAALRMSGLEALAMMDNKLSNLHTTQAQHNRHNTGTTQHNRHTRERVRKERISDTMNASGVRERERKREPFILSDMHTQTVNRPAMCREFERELLVLELRERGLIGQHFGLVRIRQH